MALDTDERTLYVANLDKNVNEELLYELFLQAGPIERVNIPSNSNDSHRYGFVTYKHDCSIDYAIELYKGTNLYKKELVIKRKGERTNNYQQANNFCSYGESNNINTGPGLLPNPAQLDFAQMLSLSQAFFQGGDIVLNNSSNFRNDNFNSRNDHFNQRNDSFGQSSLKGHWSNRSRPYTRDSRNYQPRSRDSRDSRDNRDSRDRHKDRDYGKSYHDRKGRY